MHTTSMMSSKTINYSSILSRQLVHASCKDKAECLVTLKFTWPIQFDKQLHESPFWSQDLIHNLWSTGLWCMLQFLKIKSTKAFFFMVKGTLYEEIVNLLKHFKGTKSMTSAHRLCCFREVSGLEVCHNLNYNREMRIPILPLLTMSFFGVKWWQAMVASSLFSVLILGKKTCSCCIWSFTTQSSFWENK